NDRSQLRARREILLALAQVQRDLGAARRALERRELESPAAVRSPLHAGCGRISGTARANGDAVGDDERRVEAHAELADQVRVLLLVARDPREEFALARVV